MRADPSMRHCNSAVSPVIAVILLLAITVVLASVMYLTVSSLMPPVQQNPAPLGLTVSKVGTRWVVEVVTVSAGVSSHMVYVQVTDQNGLMLVNATPLSNMTGFVDLDPKDILNPGDRLLLPIATYPDGCWITVLDNQKVLFHQQLRG